MIDFEEELKKYNPYEETEGTEALAGVSAHQDDPVAFACAQQAVRKYNVAVGYVRSGSEDLAVLQLKRVISLYPHMLQAYHLLALLLMQRGDYRKAKKTLLQARGIDSANEETLAYLKEVNSLYAARKGNREYLMNAEANRDRRVYKNGHDLVILPAYYKKTGGIRGALTVLVAFVGGLLVAWFLILPQQTEKIQQEYRAKEQALYDELNDAIIGLAGATESTDAAETPETTEEASEAPESTAGASEAPESTEGAATEEADATGTPAQTESAADETGDVLDEDVYGTEEERTYDASMTAEDYFSRAQNLYDYGDYETAISNLKKALAIDDTHLWSLYYLGRAYQMLGDADRAITVFERIIALYPDTEFADDAQRFIGQLQ